jgi:hypothetical protein
MLDKWAKKHIKYSGIKIIGACQSHHDRTKEPEVCLNEWSHQEMYRLKEEENVAPSTNTEIKPNQIACSIT